MSFRTKLDFSDNRQVKQRIETIQNLSGATTFGVTFSALPTGPDLTTSAITLTTYGVASTFSGNSGTTIFTWYDSNMGLADSVLSAITPSNSATTQNTGGVFTADTITTIDGNTVVLTYTGVSFDISVTAMVDLGGSTYSGAINTMSLNYLSANTLDFTGRTIWSDTSGITRTERLIVTNNPQVGYVLTCIDSEGMVDWQPSSGSSGTTSSYWSASTGTNAIVVNYSNSVASGVNAIAEGFHTTAIGDYSHAEGTYTSASFSGTTAVGYASHAEGISTTANGYVSHSEGANTYANGTYSHAEGKETTALGDYSHAEGVQTIASGNTSHAEGEVTTAAGFRSHAEGYNTTSEGGGSHVEGISNKTFGNGSHAEGVSTTASGDISHAEGYGTRSFGQASHVEGGGSESWGDRSHAEGNTTTSIGDGSHSEGRYTTSIGNWSHSEGHSTTSIGVGSHAEGGYFLSPSTTITGGTAIGDSSHAEGQNTTSIGIASHAQGSGTTASGYASHAEGVLTTASGIASHAEGRGTAASGLYAHTEGSFTQAIGEDAHAEGLQTTAFGQQSHAEGWATTAFGPFGHAEGQQTYALGQASHAEGAGPRATGNFSHAEGNYTTAAGQSSHSEGQTTIALGNYSHAEGTLTIAQGSMSHAEGIATGAYGDASHAGGELTTVSGTTAFGYGKSNIVNGNYSAALGGTGNTINTGVFATAIIAGSGITATQSNMVYVPDLIIDGLTSTDPLATDANGKIVAGVSDARLKQNVKLLTNSLNIINNLRGVSFEFTEASNMGPGTRYGFIAQEVQEFVPDIVRQRAKSDGVLNLNYNEIVPILVEAIKELSSGTTNNTHLETQTILAEDNNIELNYGGNQTTAIGGGITVLHAKGESLNAELITDENGDWKTNNDFIPNSLTIPYYTPSSSSDTIGKQGNITRDDDYLYIKTKNGWKRSNLENF